MRKSRFSDEQKVKMLREADETSVSAVAQKHGVSRETLYTWRRKFAGVDVNEARRLRELERENVRLKKMVVDRDLELEVMKEIAAKKW
jgi:putative transposase